MGEGGCSWGKDKSEKLLGQKRLQSCFSDFKVDAWALFFLGYTHFFFPFWF